MDQSTGTKLNRLTALYVQGKLLLAGTGVCRPLARASFRSESIADGRPPVFSLVAVDEPAARRDGPEAAFEVAMWFSVGAPPDVVIVRVDDVDLRVPVLVATDPTSVLRRVPVSLVSLADALPSRGGPLPGALEALLDRGDDVGTPLFWPLRLGPLFEGTLEPAAANPRRAIGYSERFDFAEAFLDAMRCLPRGSDAAGDSLSVVQVTHAGALVVGSQPRPRLFVAIFAY
jgi:hypothetical protein